MDNGRTLLVEFKYDFTCRCNQAVMDPSHLAKTCRTLHWSEAWIDWEDCDRKAIKL